MIDVDHISKSFKDVKALDAITFKVNKGDIFGIVGPDGAGKTTLLRTICRLIKPDSGQATLAKGLSESGQLGYMPQKFSLYGDLSVMENIHLFGSLFGMDKILIDERADRILTMTGMLAFKERIADQLSGGMRQKLAITSALITQPELLVLDEPTYGIDPISRHEIWKLLRELNQGGMTILVSTPYMNEAELCSRLGYLDNGILHFLGTPGTFKNDYPDMFYKATENKTKELSRNMAPSDYAITTTQLSRKFGQFTAVDAVDIKVPKGKIYGFLGPNGAGKTTLIKMLCGLLTPSGGEAKVLGYDLSDKSEEIKQRIGYMSQKYSLYDDLTARENLEFFAGIYGIPKGEARDNRVSEVIKMANLEGRENALAVTLSPGLKQRLALGSAILSKPELLFLDEPTSGVSPITRKDFFAVIDQLAAGGVTVILTTHFMDEAERCDVLMFMLDGRLIAEDTPFALKKLPLKDENGIKSLPNEVSLDDVFVYLAKNQLGEAQ